MGKKLEYFANEYNPRSRDVLRIEVQSEVISFCRASSIFMYPEVSNPGDLRDIERQIVPRTRGMR